MLYKLEILKNYAASSFFYHRIKTAKSEEETSEFLINQTSWFVVLVLLVIRIYTARP